MEKFNSEFDTLFIPLFSKIYTSEHFPHILYDQTALDLKDKLPTDVKCISKMVQYTYLSGAIRSKTIDEKVKEFISLNPDGVIVELNCRLSTACYRLNVKNKWYGVDAARNIKIREKLFEPRDNVIYIKANIYNYVWLNQIINENPNSHILIICVGVFNYYQKEIVQKFLNHIFKIKNLEIIFDAVNSIGMQRMTKFYKHLGIENYRTLFCIDSIDELKLENTNCMVLDQKVFFDKVDKKRIKFITRIYMKLADKFKMIRIYHICNK